MTPMSARTVLLVSGEVILEFTDKLSLKNEFINKADDHEQYINEVRHAKDKFKTVAKYYGRGLFSEELLK